MKRAAKGFLLNKSNFEGIAPLLQAIRQSAAAQMDQWPLKLLRKRNIYSRHGT